MGAGLQPWESKEHQWVESMDTTKYEQELMNTPWFDWGEEKREHWDLEKLLHSLELSDSKEEPEPSQAGNPGSAAVRLGAFKGCPDGWGGACTSPFPTGVKPQPFCSQAEVLCNQCGSWIRLAMSQIRAELTATAETEPCACSAHAHEPLMRIPDNITVNSNMNCVKDVKEAGHGPGVPGEHEDPLPHPEEHVQDVGDGAVACAPVELDRPAGEDAMARDLVRPAGGSREQECVGKSLDRMTTFTGEQMTRAMSQRVQDPEVMVEMHGKEWSRLQMMEPEGRVSGTSNVAGKVASHSVCQD